MWKKLSKPRNQLINFCQMPAVIHNRSKFYKLCMHSKCFKTNYFNFVVPLG